MTAGERAHEPAPRRQPRRPLADRPVVDAEHRGSSRRGNFVNEAGDDRDVIRAGDRVLLIVENDLAFAKVLLDAARAGGFKGLVTSSAPVRWR